MLLGNISGSEKLGNAIRAGRLELGLTVEEAAKAARVDVNTWNRYERGADIGQDNHNGVCQVLRWSKIEEELSDKNFWLDTDRYKKTGRWSQLIADEYGNNAAIELAVGSDILLDHVREDLKQLASRPKGTHLGELPFSWIKDSLPEQFLMEYNYEFLYRYYQTVHDVRWKMNNNTLIYAKSIAEILIITKIVEEARFLQDVLEMDEHSYENWLGDFLDDMDIELWFAGMRYLKEDSMYHFNHWFEGQFSLEGSYDAE